MLQDGWTVNKEANEQKIPHLAFLRKGCSFQILSKTYDDQSSASAFRAEQYHQDEGRNLLWNVGTCLPNYTESCQRKQ
jgi:hypothetical protein